VNERLLSTNSRCAGEQQHADGERIPVEHSLC
jgi:hypothetical protein